MKAPSNDLKILRTYYQRQLEPLYGVKESSQLVLLLIRHFFGIDRAGLAIQNELRLTESEMLKLHFAVKDLLQHKPVQYITGTTEFLGSTFVVRPGVLIPRPETEQLVHSVIKGFQNCNPLTIWDLGTGSGCIAISLALAFPMAQVTAFDFSEAALALATENANLLHANITIRKANILNQDFFKPTTKVDLLVSNPPYVRQSEQQYMKENVYGFEPKAALFVPDEDPLLFYKAIAKTAHQVLIQGGALWLEINEALGKETAAVCKTFGFEEVLIHKDFHGRDRFISAVKQSSKTGKALP